MTMDMTLHQVDTVQSPANQIAIGICYTFALMYAADTAPVAMTACFASFRVMNNAGSVTCHGRALNKV